MPNVGKPFDRETPQPDTGRNEPEANKGPNRPPLVKESEIAGSMRTEEPLGWDQAPTDIQDPEKQRQPRPDGRGGLHPAPQKQENNPIDPNNPTGQD